MEKICTPFSTQLPHVLFLFKFLETQSCVLGSGEALALGRSPAQARSGCLHFGELGNWLHR